MSAEDFSAGIAFDYAPRPHETTYDPFTGQTRTYDPASNKTCVYDPLRNLSQTYDHATGKLTSFNATTGETTVTTHDDASGVTTMVNLATGETRSFDPSSWESTTVDPISGHTTILDTMTGDTSIHDADSGETLLSNLLSDSGTQNPSSSASPVHHHEYPWEKKEDDKSEATSDETVVSADDPEAALDETGVSADSTDGWVTTVDPDTGWITIVDQISGATTTYDPETRESTHYDPDTGLTTMSRADQLASPEAVEIDESYVSLDDGIDVSAGGFADIDDPLALDWSDTTFEWPDELDDSSAEAPPAAVENFDIEIGVATGPAHRVDEWLSEPIEISDETMWPDPDEANATYESDPFANDALDAPFDPEP